MHERLFVLSFKYVGSVGLKCDYHVSGHIFFFGGGGGGLEDSQDQTDEADEADPFILNVHCITD